MGPDTYDLASLLRDSYVDFTDEERDGLVGEFEALRRTRPGARQEDSSGVPAALRPDVAAAQPQGAGHVLGFQAATRGNAAYVQHVPRTLAHVRTNLERYPRFKAPAPAAWPRTSPEPR